MHFINDSELATDGAVGGVSEHLFEPEWLPA
jgi:hypothetical protein